MTLDEARKMLDQNDLFSEEQLREACRVMLAEGDLHDCRDARAIMNDLDGLSQPDEPDDSPVASIAPAAGLLVASVLGLIVVALMMVRW